MQTTFDMFIETEVPENELIISRTDLKGNITYANDTFAHISGYEVSELVGKPHNIVRHPDMPKSVFKDLWETLRKDGYWQGYVKNKRKDGGYYWVHAEISGVFKSGELIEYKSLRQPISKAKKIQMQNRYDDYRRIQEHQIRIISYLNDAYINKVKQAAKANQIDEDTMLERIIEKYEKSLKN